MELSPSLAMNESPTEGSVAGRLAEVRHKIQAACAEAGRDAAAVTLVYLPASVLVYVPTATAIFAGGVLPPK